jgi:hypothetical protein
MGQMKSKRKFSPKIILNYVIPHIRVILPNPYQGHAPTQ